MTYALYYELAKGTSVYQALFVPTSTLLTHILPPTYFRRELTEAEPNRRWTATSDEPSPDFGDPHDGMRDLLARAVEELEGLAGHMRTALAAGWDLRLVIPIYLEDSHKIPLKTDNTRLPVPLQERVSTVRRDAGLPPLPGRQP